VTIPTFKDSLRITMDSNDTEREDLGRACIMEIVREDEVHNTHSYRMDHHPESHPTTTGDRRTCLTFCLNGKTFEWSFA